jgi:A/G-specific adenine glycosylase
MEMYGGRIPQEYEELQKLKGIGSYTAGAIASIAYGKAVPAVDGNVLRVISRAAADDRDIGKPSVRRNMEQQLSGVIPKDAAGSYNQALMELGATVCLPGGVPKCGECPWMELCLAKKEGRTTALPVKTKAAGRRKEERTILLIRDGEKVVLAKRPARGLLAGMYEFPNLKGYLDEDQAVSHVRKMDLNPLRIERLADAKHIFSHVEWHMKGYLIRVEALGDEEPARQLFVDLADFKEKYPIPSAFGAYTDYLNIRQGKERF